MRRAGVVLGIALALAGCGDRQEAGVYTGYVEAEYVSVAAPRPGWIEALDVREGDPVAAGQPLFRLDADQQQLVVEQAKAQAREAGARVEDASRGARPAEIARLEAQVSAARTQLAYAAAELERGLRLEPGGAIAQAQLDALKTQKDNAAAQLEAARKAVDTARLAAREGVREAAAAAETAAEAAAAQAEWELGQRSVSARSAGRVDTIVRREGEFVAAGAPVLTILPDHALKVRFFVPQAEISALAPGAPVRIAADGADPVDAAVSYIAREAEFTPPVIYSEASRGDLVFAVEARLPRDAALRPGLPVTVRLP